MPSAEAAVRLAKALKTSVEYLITGENAAVPSDSEEKRKLLHVYEALPEVQRKLLIAVAEDIAKCMG